MNFMEKRHWKALSIVFLVGMIVFIGIDNVNNSYFYKVISPNNAPLSEADVYFIVNEAVLDPVIYAFAFLWIAFAFLAWREPNQAEKLILEEVVKYDLALTNYIRNTSHATEKQIEAYKKKLLDKYPLVSRKK